MKYGVMAMLAGAGLMLGTLAGCETLSQTPGENANTMARTIDTNGKQIPEDVESILLLNQPSILSEKPIPH